MDGFFKLLNNKRIISAHKGISRSKEAVDASAGGA
jgi:hypothetical protein